MRVLSLILFFIVVSISAKDKKEYAWYDAAKLGVEGRAWSTSKHYYNRLPDKAEKLVRKPLWDLSLNTAGMCVHFMTNSKTVAVKYKARFGSHYPHMTDVVVKGVDLYALDGEKWVWAGASKPYGKEVNQVLIEKMDGNWREYKLYLPCYDGVDELFIGLDTDSKIQKIDRKRYKYKPIVFYGTSIMQGCSASRSGYVTSNIIGRQIDAETVNLGFSGNGKLEPELAKLMVEIDASCYVVDCLPNLNPEQVKKRAIPFVQQIRKFRPNVPVILVGSTDDQRKSLMMNKYEYSERKNENLKEAYTLLKLQGVRNLHFVNGEDLLGDGNNNTIDAIHYSDLGYINYVKKVVPVIREAIK